ncbi:MAG: hypothetical protein ACLFQK_00075 [Fibrobacterota bacterium]
MLSIKDLKFILPVAISVFFCAFLSFTIIADDGKMKSFESPCGNFLIEIGGFENNPKTGETEVALMSSAGKLLNSKMLKMNVVRFLKSNDIVWGKNFVILGKAGQINYSQ